MKPFKYIIHFSEYGSTIVPTYLLVDCIFMGGWGAWRGVVSTLKTSVYKQLVLPPTS